MYKGKNEGKLRLQWHYLDIESAVKFFNEANAEAARVPDLEAKIKTLEAQLAETKKAGEELHAEHVKLQAEHEKLAGSAGVKVQSTLGGIGNKVGGLFGKK